MPVVVRGDQEAIGQTHLEIDEPSQTKVWAPIVEHAAAILAREEQARKTADAMAVFLEGTVQLTLDDEAVFQAELAAHENLAA